MTSKRLRRSLGAAMMLPAFMGGEAMADQSVPLMSVPIKVAATSQVKPADAKSKVALDWGGFGDGSGDARTSPVGSQANVTAGELKPVLLKPAQAALVAPTPAATPKQSAAPAPAPMAAPAPISALTSAPDQVRAPTPAPVPAQTATPAAPVAMRADKEADVQQAIQVAKAAPLTVEPPLRAMPKGYLPKSGGVALPVPPDYQETRRFTEQIVRKALANSPDIREAEAKWRASQLDVDQTKGERWPQVQVGVASSQKTFGSGTETSPTGSAGSVAITTPIFDWGRIDSTVDSRTESAKAAYEILEQTRQKVAYDTLSSLVELKRNQMAFTVNENYVKRMDELVTMLSQITESDPGRASELTQARARRLQALTTRDQYAAKVREINVNLVKLVGETVQVPPSVQWDGNVVNLEEAISAALDHPALRQARAEARAATYYADSVKASRLPQLNWLVSKTTQTDVFGNRQPWSTSLSVQWNAFQGGSAEAAQAAAYARANAGEEKAQTATRDLEFSLRSSAVQRDASLSRAAEFGQLSKESDKVRQIFYEQWYHLGRRTLLDVLTAESEHFNNLIAQVNNRYDGEAADLRMRADAAILLRSLFPNEGNGQVAAAATPGK